MIFGRRKTPSRNQPRRNQYRIVFISFGKGSIPPDMFTMQHENVRRTDSEMKTFKLEGQSELQVFILQVESEDRQRIEHDLIKNAGTVYRYGLWTHCESTKGKPQQCHVRISRQFYEHAMTKRYNKHHVNHRYRRTRH